MATMAAMAAIASVLSCMVIRDYVNQTSSCRDTFGMSIESSLAGVQDEFQSISCKYPQRSSGQHRNHQGEFGSTSGALGCVRCHVVTGQLVARTAVQHAAWFG